MKKEHGLQVDLFNQPVHILNTKEIYRMAKCGRCGNTVKISQTKTHISFGKALTICLDCLKKEGKTYQDKRNKKKQKK